MLLLTSTNDRLQIISSTAATLTVHASWVDTSAGTITPGRTNTAISSATTTSVAGAPAASTQRNVKTLHVRNTHATLNNDITVQHTDGTVVSQLYKCTLGPGDMLEYTDQAGFGGGRAAAVTGGTNPTRTVFTTGSGTYTTPAGVTYLEVEMVGGGGGGANGNLGAIAPGTDGGASTFGTLTAGGGKGATNSGGGSVGGISAGGDINISGEQGPGNANIADGSVSASGNTGGASFFGGAGSGQFNTAGGNAAPNTGSGGGGGASSSSAGGLAGYGGGAGGYLRKLITAPLATYAYAVGAGGAGAAAAGSGFAGGNGAAGMIVITEYYK